MVSYTNVFSTGGIGPTHDDITSKSVSKAFKRKYVYNEEAFKILNNKNIFPAHFNMRFVKPLDEELLHDICKKFKFNWHNDHFTIFTNP